MNFAGPLNVAGVVLVGGKSRRMGQDKATVDFDGQPLAEVAVSALLAAGASQVATIGPFAVTGAEQCADRWPGEGPLAGIITGLTWASALEPAVDGVVVVACDLPFLNADAILALLEAANRKNAGEHGVLGFDGARHQPLFVYLRSSAFAKLERTFAAGERSPKLAYESLALSVADAVADGRLADVDTPAELEAAREQKRRIP